MIASGARIEEEKKKKVWRPWEVTSQSDKKILDSKVTSQAVTQPSKKTRPYDENFPPLDRKIIRARTQPGKKAGKLSEDEQSKIKEVTSKEMPEWRDKSFTPKEISAMVLGKRKEIAMDFLGKKVTNTVSEEEQSKIKDTIKVAKKEAEEDWTMVSRGKTSNKRKANSIPGLGSPDQGIRCTGGATLMPKARDQPCRGGKLVEVKGFKHGLAGGAQTRRGLPGGAAKRGQDQNQNQNQNPAERVKRRKRTTKQEKEQQKTKEMEEQLLVTNDSEHGLQIIKTKEKGRGVKVIGDSCWQGQGEGRGGRERGRDQCFPC